MTPLLILVIRAFHLGLLRSASLLVPGKRRGEWSQGWLSELWYVQRECSPVDGVGWRAIRGVTAFCLGAYQDAFYLRRRVWAQEGTPLARFRGSASLCILLLAATLALSYGVAFLSPGVRAERQLSRYRVYSGTVLRTDARYQSDMSSTISPEMQFRAWMGNRQRFFDGVAFYRIDQETISTTPRAQDGWAVAHASSNLFALLDSSIRFVPKDVENNDGLPRVILSDEIWRRDFGGNAHIGGSVLRVGRCMVRIAGVAPRGFWRLPGKVDAWLLEPNSEIGYSGSEYAVAHLTPPGEFQIGPRWVISLFAVLFAFLALPAITSMSKGEYSLGSQKLSLERRLWRWGFLCAKIALLIPIVYFASLDFAYSCMSSFSTPSGYIHFACSFSICFLGLGWVFQDQQQRCPICLKRVTNPTTVGQPSRIFELICVGGHTLLHVPEMPINRFSAQRGLYLDASWRFMFASSGVGTSGK
jgi:hypothetical protein